MIQVLFKDHFDVSPQIKFLIFSFMLDKKTDLSEFMANADQRGDRIVKFFIKYFSMAGPIVIFIQCLANIIYVRFKYGYIDPATLFRPVRLVYENWNNLFAYF